jgi:small redox-active disulfide protein 2
MTVKVLGACCKNCNTLTENVRKALAELRVDCPVEKVTDLGEIMRYGVMSIPALVINDQVVAAGRVLSPKEIAALLRKAAE